MHRLRSSFFRFFLPSCAALLGAAVVSGGCATKRSSYPAADAPLQLQRVVLYRNGIGYFERHGRVDEPVLHLKVRRDQVDDLLKSLTVIDRERGRAVSISMPLDADAWARAALADWGPGEGDLASVLDGLRGQAVVLHTMVGRIDGRIVMVEEIVNEPDPSDRSRSRNAGSERSSAVERDHKVTLIEGDRLEVVRLSKVRGITVADGDLALQLHRRLDAAAGEGMFQQIDVDIRLSGAKAHDLVVSYVVAAPMWKPTYRVVLPESGKGEALLQGWAVVDNVSGEDWREVTMSLTSGEPIAFRYDLHTPRDVDRADLTEAGVRKRARVAVGETTFALEDEEGEMPASEPAPSDDAWGAEDVEAQAAQKPKRKARKAESKKDAPGAPPASKTTRGGPVVGAEADRGPAVDYDALRRSTQASARAKAVSGLTRYELGERVTVPNGSSTMVAILNETVQGEETFLYKPGGAGIGYESNPYRVVRFKNSTPFVLEPGPISIYAGGSFVGEGLSEAVGTNTSATIPFAVEPGIMVTSKRKHSGDEMHLLRIVRGVLEVESFAQTTTTWTAKAQAQKGGFKVLVRHSKAGWNYALADAPKGTEELPDGYLVPLEVPRGKIERSVEIVERTPSKTTISIWDGRAIGLLEKVLASTNLPAEMRAELEPIVRLRQDIGRIDTEIAELQQQKAELDQRANETRQNLEAIKKDPAASRLRKRLSKRLEDFTSEGDRLARRIVELQSQRLEKKIQLEDGLQDLDLRPPPRKAGRAASPASK